MKAVVYSTPSCPYCNQAKDYFKENNVEFEDFNVAEDQAKAQEMVKKSGQMGVPVIDLEGTIIVGFDKAKINEVLGL
ncbi:NrdH-redoxin [Candidatus Parcubacteria bacterium]|nr:MAG: NrdH-redoxin [Candidatus Parcubacteria bacterium]